MRVMSGTLLMPVWTLRSWRPQSLISHKQVYREAVGIKPVASRISGTKVPLREISNSSFNELTTALWSPHSHTSLELCYVNPLLKRTLLIKCKTATLRLFLDYVFFFLSCCSIVLCIMKLKRNYLFFLQSTCSCV